MEEVAFHRHRSRYHVLGVMRSNGPLSVHERTESIRLLDICSFLCRSNVHNCMCGGMITWEKNRIIPQKSRLYRFPLSALSMSPEFTIVSTEIAHFSILS